jgi:hypothetical protein
MGQDSPTGLAFGVMVGAFPSPVDRSGPCDLDDHTLRGRSQSSERWQADRQSDNVDSLIGSIPEAGMTQRRAGISRPASED